jgi:hypothetical protein
MLKLIKVKLRKLKALMLPAKKIADNLNIKKETS